MLTIKDIVMIVLIIVELGFVVYYKVKLHIIESGFITLAKMSYKITNKAECEELAQRIVEAQRNEN